MGFRSVSSGDESYKRWAWELRMAIFFWELSQAFRTENPRHHKQQVTAPASWMNIPHDNRQRDWATEKARTYLRILCVISLLFSSLKLTQAATICLYHLSEWLQSHSQTQLTHHKKPKTKHQKKNPNNLHSFEFQIVPADWRRRQVFLKLGEEVHQSGFKQGILRRH